MEYQLVINANKGDSDCRMGTSGWFTYCKAEWYTWKTRAAAERKIRIMDEWGEFADDSITILSFPDALDIIKSNHDTYKAGIEELERYLNLDKFQFPDNHVTVTDIFLRLDEIKRNLL